MEAEWLKYSRFVADKAGAAMKRQNLTQASLGKKINRSQQYVSHVLNGRENLTLETLSILDSALDIKIMRSLLSVAEDKEHEECLLKEDKSDFYRGASDSSLDTVISAGRIIRRFDTGDRPFLVMGEDSLKYLCKGARFGNGSYGLARELVGTVFAGKWGLTDSKISLVRLLPQHSDGLTSTEDYSLPCLGRLWIENAVEISDRNHSYIRTGYDAMISVMKIALFDLWMANEDRLNNNLNLLYSFETGKIIAIDHAGIFNTGFSAPLLSLSLTDSVLYSDFFSNLAGCRAPASSDMRELESFFQECTDSCEQSVSDVRKMIPESWGIRFADFDDLCGFIFSSGWRRTVLETFNNILQQCLNR